MWLIWNENMILIPHPTPVNFLGNCFVNNFCICESLCFFFPLSKKKSVIDFLTGYSHSEPLWRSHLAGLGAPSGRSSHHPSLCSWGRGVVPLSEPGKVGFDFSLRRTPRAENRRDVECVIHVSLYTVLYSFQFIAAGCLGFAKIAGAPPVLTAGNHVLKQH